MQTELNMNQAHTTIPTGLLFLDAAMSLHNVHAVQAEAACLLPVCPLPPLQKSFHVSAIPTALLDNIYPANHRLRRNVLPAKLREVWKKRSTPLQPDKNICEHFDPFLSCKKWQNNPKYGNLSREKRYFHQKWEALGWSKSFDGTILSSVPRSLLENLSSLVSNVGGKFKRSGMEYQLLHCTFSFYIKATLWMNQTKSAAQWNQRMLN